MSHGFAGSVCKSLKRNENVCNKLQHDHRREKSEKSLISLVPDERIELPTNGLQNRCSTAELIRLRA